jgi:hypothetical protein
MRFARALWTEWATLLTGGSIIAIVFIWSTASGKSVPPGVNWLVLALTLIIAAFLAWRKQAVFANSSTPIPTSAAAKPKRVFVRESPESLMALCKGLTSLMSEPIVAAYKGKWIKVSSDVLNVSKSFQSTGYEVLAYTSASNIQYNLHFTRDWNEEVSILRPKHNVQAVGRISHFGSSHLFLCDCEITSPHEADSLTPEAPPTPTPDPQSPPPSQA